MSQLLKDLRQEQEHYEPFNFDRYERVKRIADHIAILEDKLKIAVDGLEEIRVNYPNSTFNTFHYTKHILDQLKETK